MFPEAALVLNETAAAIVRLCDGARSVEQIVAELQARFSSRDTEEIAEAARAFLETVRRRGLLE